jgi:pSer/pThr/pTyr-binding forkhead associated (FHA) protein
VLLAGSQRLLLRGAREADDSRRGELVQVLPLGHSGRVQALDKDSIVVGKSTRADFCFPEDHYLSRRHAEIVNTARGLVVRDLGSTNRTYLIVKDERPLEDGDRIVLGEQLFEYRLEENS